MEKVRRLEKGTPPPVVAVVTIMRYESYVGVLLDLVGDDEDPVVAVSWGSVSLRCCWDGWTRGR